MNATPPDFDFDRLVAQAKEAPDQFVRSRDDLIRKAMENAPQSANVASLQMYIDSERYTHSPGLDSCRHALDMTIESVEALTLAVLSLTKIITDEELSSECPHDSLAVRNLHGETKE